MLNSAGAESMQAKWEEMFGAKEEKAVVEEVEVKKPRNKVIIKKDKREKKATAKKKTEPKEKALRKKSGGKDPASE